MKEFMERNSSLVPHSFSSSVFKLTKNKCRKQTCRIIVTSKYLSWLLWILKKTRVCVCLGGCCVFDTRWSRQVKSSQTNSVTVSQTSPSLPSLVGRSAIPGCQRQQSGWKIKMRPSEALLVFGLCRLMMFAQTWGSENLSKIMGSLDVKHWLTRRIVRLKEAQNSIGPWFLNSRLENVQYPYRVPL